MAARFDRLSLPEPHERGQLLRVEPETYRCFVVRLRDPDDEAPDAGDHLVVELPRSDAPPAPRKRAPWARA